MEVPGGYYADGQELLRTWDFSQSADSPAAAYFNVVWRNVLELTFHDDLPEEVWPDGGAALGRGHVRAARPGPPTRGGTTSTTDDEVETRDDILRHGDAATPATS